MGFPLPELPDGLYPAVRQLLAATPRLVHEKGRERVTTHGVLLSVWQANKSRTPLELYAFLLRFAQEWIARYPLFVTVGNFGSIDGDPPAGMRYNELGLASWLKDASDSDSAPFAKNGFPHLLVNGAFAHTGEIETDATEDTEVDEESMEPLVSHVPTGRLVGGTLLSFVPPHNLQEIASALSYLLDHARPSFQDILGLIHGPDFPTGGILANPEELATIYRTGEGSLTLRARLRIEKGEKGRTLIVISEIPYATTKTAMIEAIADRVHDGRAAGVSDLRDLTTRDTMHVEIELRRDQPPLALIEFLRQQGILESRIEVRMAVAKEGQEVRVGLLDLLRSHLDQRRLHLGSERQLRDELRSLAQSGDARRTQIGT